MSSPKSTRCGQQRAQAGEDIIDLGMGNPDLPPPPHVIDKLCEVARKPDAHGYSQSKGIPGLRRAQANYYGRRFGVELDPESEVVVTMGSKEGLASLATAITAPGDVVLAPNPSYPIHTFGFIIAGATIRAVPTTPDENYFEALERAMRLHRAAPERAGGQLSRRTRPPRWSTSRSTSGWSPGRKENKVWVISDLAYSELYYRRQADAVSILQVPGREGRRGRVHLASARPIRWPAGGSASRSATSELIAALTRVKSYLDYGAFTPIQAAACAALNGPQDIVETQPRALPASAATCWSRASAAPAGTSRRRRPRCSPGRRCRRRSRTWAALSSPSNCSPTPKSRSRRASAIGENGEGFVRIALVENEQRLRQAARNVKRYLQQMGVNTPAA